jgi:hypothetical protein
MLSVNAFRRCYVVHSLRSNVGERVYAAHPERLYVIGADGTVLFKGGKGPFGYDVDELDAWLSNDVPTE